MKVLVPIVLFAGYFLGNWFIRKRFKISYISRIGLFIGYTLLFVLIGFGIYELFDINVQVSLVNAVLLTFVMVGLGLIFYKFYRNKGVVVPNLENVYCSKFCNEYLFTKIGEVFLQQLGVYGLLIVLFSYSIPLWSLSILFGILFMSLHLPLLFHYESRKTGVVYIVSSLIWGLVLPVVYSLNYGFEIAYIIHFMFYIFGLPFALRWYLGKFVT